MMGRAHQIPPPQPVNKGYPSGCPLFFIYDVILPAADGKIFHKILTTYAPKNIDICFVLVYYFKYNEKLWELFLHNINFV